jgi:hypothetical protein
MVFLTVWWFILQQLKFPRKSGAIFGCQQRHVVKKQVPWHTKYSPLILGKQGLGEGYQKLPEW